MKNGETVRLHAYLYTFYNGKLKKYRGDVIVHSVLSDTGYFTARDSKGKKLKTLNCSAKKGVMYNRTIWFTKSEKVKAIEAFMTKEQLEIAELRKRIDNHERDIDILRGLAANELIMTDIT